MSEIERRPSRDVPLFGVFLILLGIALLLGRFQLLSLSWPRIIWIFLAAFGLAQASKGFARDRSGGVFTGSLLFFVSVVFLLKHFELLPYRYEELLPELSIAFGLAFFVVFLHDPRSFGLLIFAVTFCGLGALYYLWWWDIVDIYDVRRYLRIYWPGVIILLGLSLILKRRK
ncbi:MAG TPA: hypothetical protein VMM57_11010 [Bacteroidota bacterium]|nr:hypothetical protein [Bacteroidota bacterium]